MARLLLFRYFVVVAFLWRRPMFPLSPSSPTFAALNSQRELQEERVWGAESKRHRERVEHVDLYALSSSSLPLLCLFLSVFPQRSAFFGFRLLCVFFRLLLILFIFTALHLPLSTARFIKEICQRGETIAIATLEGPTN